MSFAPENYVRLLSTNDVQEVSQYVGRNVTVSFNKAEIFATPNASPARNVAAFP